MQKCHRIFIAINLPNDIKKQLDMYKDKWPELPAKWTTKDNLHITLEFLGDLTDEELGEVCVAVKEVAKRHSSFSISLNSVSYGPPKKIPPRMIWVEGERTDELADLKQDLQEFLVEKIYPVKSREAGILPEAKLFNRVNFRPEACLPAGREKGFTPHITLARIKEWEWKKIESEERPEVNEEIDLTFTVESVEVMESVLKRGGPEYTILESCQLSN